MALRQQSIWDGKQNQGYVDIGTGTSENFVKASEAYVFMLVCLNESWKLPLGYFLTHGLTGTQKANLIEICLSKCQEVGIKVVSLTFDGHPTNLSAMELLGCQIKDTNKLITTFKHPSADYRVAVFLDACHMVKLIRNHFEDKKTFLDTNKEEVDWEYIDKLNDLQEKSGIHLANKLTRKHLKFRNSIMKVKLATQLLSRSVALALKCCRNDLKLKDFEKSEATEKFVLIFNNLFDVLNSRSLKQFDFGHPLMPGNKTKIFTFLNDAKEYITKLSIKTSRKRTYKETQQQKKITIKTYESVIKTKAYTGFLGMLVCIESLKYVYETLVEQTKELNYIAAYRISQDHIELLFGAIRMHGGHNDNPNARQLKGIYKKLLCHMELKLTETGNCVPLEDIAILNCSSAITAINSTTKSRRFDEEDEEISALQYSNGDQNEESQEGLCNLLDQPGSHEYYRQIVGYIAGCIVRQLNRKIKCMPCNNSLISKEKLEFHKLVGLRDKGGLNYASENVFTVCWLSEEILRNHLKEKQIISEKDYKLLMIKILTNLIGRTLFNFNEIDHAYGRHHQNNILKLIVEGYVKIRLFHVAKSENIQKSVPSKRQIFKKNLQFQGL